MQHQITTFILVPDSSTARHLRQIIATQSPCMGAQTGIWPEPIELKA